VQKLWSVFFGVVLTAIFALCAVAPWVGWWLPQNVSSYGGDVDALFYIILAITGVTFVFTEVLLVWFMYQFAYNPNRRARYVEGNHRLELVWTVATAAVLLYVAFTQVNVWENIKYHGRMPEPSLTVQVTGRQWEWHIRYPAPLDVFDQPAPLEKTISWAEAPEIDDVRTSNELHTWVGAKVRIYLKTEDVIHSFGLPNLRLMQDALPGKTIPMWFKATTQNTHWLEAEGRCYEPPDASQRWEIACKELCGGGHYRMRGRLYVHPDEDDFRKWLSYRLKAQQSHEPEKTPSAAATPVASNTKE
jgi:cytochrome c oxidase subunit II